MKRGLQALGRLKVGTMNKTEQAYAATLDQRRIAGEVAWFKFEGIKLRLADNTFYTPDFFVMLSGGALEAHEVKGTGPTTRARRSRLPPTSTRCGSSRSRRSPRRTAAGGKWKSFSLRLYV